MGFLDRFTKGPAVPDKLMSDEQAAQLAEARQLLAQQVAANPGAMPDVNDPGAMAAFAQRATADRERIERIATSGVTASAVIRSVQPTGNRDLGGGCELRISVAVDGVGDAVVVQSLLPAQADRLTPGHAVTVKYDPAAPGEALLHDW